jgi:hypothetical protein
MPMTMPGKIAWKEPGPWLSSILGVSLLSLPLGLALVIEAAPIALSAEQNQSVPKLVPAVAQVPTQAQGTSVTLGSTTVPIPWE